MRIAVIGSGISGLSCAWLLSKGHKVDLFEKNSYFGGHSNTEKIKVNEMDISVDTGFIVFNEINYPNLCNLFKSLNVESYESDMSFAFSKDKGALEYGGSNMSSIFGQKSNFLNLKFIKMLFEIVRFYKSVELDKENFSFSTIDEYLHKKNYSDFFKYNHIYPMASSIWSSSLKDIKKYPLREFVDFFSNHGLLKFFDRPKWRTVLGGSRNYVEKIIRCKNINPIKNCNVKVVRRNGKYVEIKIDKKIIKYDYVVLAVHADQIKNILENMASNERKIFSKIQYKKNKVFLHFDESLMPKLKKVWSSWNYLENGKNEISVTYWMNQLQKLETSRNIFVTLNPSQEPKKDKTYKIIHYEHPIFNCETFEAQKDIKLIQGENKTWFCGAYLGYGFHEDGIKSGLNVAEKMSGMRREWLK